MAPTTPSSGLVLTDHVINVPLDHGAGGGETIDVFAREVAAPDGLDRPYLLFLQGGPGQEAPRPTGQPSAPSWLARALRDFRVLLLDQRGTGRSTPYGAPGTDPAADAERLTHFRADAIVQDAECLREHLGVARWSLLGQSFGGFCALHYLSTAPDRLAQVLFTGGLPPVGRSADDIYATTFDRMRELDERYHQRFPGDADRISRLLELCDAGDLHGLHGEPVTRRLLRTIGNQLGMDGGAEAVHYLLERDPHSPAFAHDLAGLVPFNARNPLYAVLHESSCADGVVTGWAASRVEPADFTGDSARLTGEHLFPWHFEDCPDLRPYREVAGILAEHPWPRLYDPEILRRVDVPCAAAIYVDDPFVDRAYSEETADLLPHLSRWITGDYLHNGLRSDGGRVLDELIGRARGTA